MVSVRRLHGSEGKAKGHKGRQLSSSSKVDYVNLLLDFTRQFQLYGVTASTFKTCESDRIRFRTVLFMVYMVRLHEVPTVLFMVYTVRLHEVETVLFMVYTVRPAPVSAHVRNRRTPVTIYLSVFFHGALRPHKS